LAGIAEEIEQYLSQPHGVHGQCAKVLLGVNDEAVLVLLGKLSGGADDLVDQRGLLPGFWGVVELFGLDLRQVEYLVDEAKKVGAGAVHALQRLLRLFRAEARRIFDHHLGEPDDGIERRAQLVAHAGYELRLVPARLRELPVLVLDFVEQTHVLNRDHCLVREGSSQVDLLFGERLDSPSVQDNHANRSTFAQQGHSQHRANVAELHPLSHSIFRVGLNIMDMNYLAFESYPPSNRSAAWLQRMAFHHPLKLG